MEIKEINNRNYLGLFNETLSNKIERVLIGVADNFVVLRGNNCINEQYCKDNNIEIYNSQHTGGCIVLGDGDVEFNVFRYDGWDDCNNLRLLVFDFLKQKIPTLAMDNNDFIVDGKYKVASCSSINAGDGFIYTGFHFSVNVNLEHIKNICQKPMVKTPKGLSDYGVTSNQIIEFLSSLLKEKMGENYVVQ